MLRSLEALAWLTATFLQFGVRREGVPGRVPGDALGGCHVDTIWKRMPHVYGVHLDRAILNVARVAELADARDLKSLGRKAVRVRSPALAPQRSSGREQDKRAGL